MRNEKNKALKDLRKQISGLDEEKDIKSAQKKCQEILEEILNTYGKEKYENELKTMFTNLRNFYLYRGGNLPEQYYPVAVQYAEVLLEKNNLRLAQEVVLSSASIVKDQNEIDEVAQADIEKFKILREEILKISALIIKQNEEEMAEVIDKLNEKLGRNAQFELFLKLTEEIDLEELEGDILVPNTKLIDHDDQRVPTQRSPLPNYLLPAPRLNFIIHEAFEGRKIKAYRGIKAFDDYLIFEIEGLDSVVVEKFFEKDKEKGHRIAEGKDATFIVPKEFVLDLQSLSKSDLQEFRQVYPAIKRFNHKSGTIEPLPENAEELDYDLIHYYRNFKTKFNGSIGYEYFEGFGLDDPNINKASCIKGKRTRTGKLTKPKTKKKEGKTKEEEEMEQPTEVPETENDEEQIEQPTEVPEIENDEKTEVSTLGEKERLSAILKEKIAVVNKYRDMLTEARSKKEDVTELSEKLSKAVAEMESTNEQIRSMED